MIRNSSLSIVITFHQAIPFVECVKVEIQNKEFIAVGADMKARISEFLSDIAGAECILESDITIEKEIGKVVI